eukprot:261990_1
MKKCQANTCNKFSLGGLLDIGDGIYPNKNGLVAIPKQIQCNFHNIHSFIQSVYGDIASMNPHMFNETLLNNAIVTPKNEHVTKLNDIAVNKFHGAAHRYHSIDTLELDSISCDYPTEYNVSIS